MNNLLLKKPYGVDCPMIFSIYSSKKPRHWFEQSFRNYVS